MARKPLKPCAHRGCPKLTRDRWCGDHQHDNWAAWQARHGTATERGYDAAWRKKRDRILARDDYLCVPCRKQDNTTAAREVDHIVPKEQGGTDDDDNLQSICKTCHRAKTARERSATRGARVQK